MKQLKKLSLQSNPYRSKEEFRKEAYTIIRANSKFYRDKNYQFFIIEILKGLLENVEIETVNEIIKKLQKIKQRKKVEEYEEMY